MPFSGCQILAQCQCKPCAALPAPAGFATACFPDFKKDETRDIILELSKKVYDLVLSYKGSTTGEHNDGIIRSAFLEQMYGEKIFNLFKQTKNKSSLHTKADLFKKNSDNANYRDTNLIKTYLLHDDSIKMDKRKKYFKNTEEMILNRLAISLTNL